MSPTCRYNGALVVAVVAVVPVGEAGLEGAVVDAGLVDAGVVRLGAGVVVVGVTTGVVASPGACPKKITSSPRTAATAAIPMTGGTSPRRSLGT